MSSKAEPLTPASVLATIGPLLQRLPDAAGDTPRCVWCHGPAVWTTGNKVRCTICGFVPS